MVRSLSFLVCFSASVIAVAENWPGWRGPRGDGTSVEVHVPVEWNGETGEGVAWKVELPGKGHSSPVVWDQNILLTSCLEESHERLLLCVSRTDGSLRWKKSVLVAPLETKHNLNSFASGTPATDGQTVYATFLVTDGHEIPAPNVGTPRPVTPGQMLVVAYDMNGEKLWTAEPGGFTCAHGFGSSPVIYRNLLIINGDHDGDSYVAALNRESGELVWKVPREYGIRSYCTPLIRTINGSDQMVMSGSKRIVSLDPLTGATNWLIEGPTEQFVSSMVYDGNLFYLTAGYPTHHVMAISPEGSGDVTETHVVWQSQEAKSYVPSPVLAADRLMVADDRGTVNCFDTIQGRRLWQDRLGNHYSASLVTANGLVYFPAEDGIMAVVKPDNQLNVLHRNPLGEYSYASPAISNGQIFIRGEHHLFAIGTDSADSSAAPR